LELTGDAEVKRLREDRESLATAAAFDDDVEGEERLSPVDFEA